jgi:hypothetical protein
MSQSDNRNDFPRHGPQLISLDAVFAAFQLDQRLSLEKMFSCTLCGFQSIIHSDLHYMFYDGSVGCFGANVPVVVDVEGWISAQLGSERDPDHPPSCQCRQAIPPPSTQLVNPYFWPPVLVFHPFRLASTRLRPSAKFQLPPEITDSQSNTATYHLFAVTYYGQSHFTARIRHGSRWFNYDGMAPLPTLVPMGRTELETMTLLEDMDGRFPTHLLYMLQDTEH